jgi:N6-adenosine-specific RNA methylase IME4
VRYPVILADPPWSYHVRSKASLGHGVATSHYDTMTLDDIKALPVADMAAKNAALFLWATPPCITEALEVIRAWGFAYKTFAFSWLKLKADGQPVNNGLGHYTRSNVEVCLLGLRGKMTVQQHDVQQVIRTVRRGHSRKPDEQYGRIMRLFDGPYLEVFARQCWPGWDTWGNQSGKFASQPFLIPEQTV